MDRASVLRSHQAPLNTTSDNTAPTIERVDSATIFNPSAHPSSSFPPPDSHHHPSSTTSPFTSLSTNPRDSQYTQTSDHTQHSLHSDGAILGQERRKSTASTDTQQRHSVVNKVADVLKKPLKPLQHHPHHSEQEVETETAADRRDKGTEGWMG